MVFMLNILLLRCPTLFSYFHFITFAFSVFCLFVFLKHSPDDDLQEITATVDVEV